MPDIVDTDLRKLLAKVTALPAATVDALADDTPLLTGELGISSRAGAQLLLAVRDRFGVDVGQEDLALTSLESIGSLSAFIRARLH
ncbi:acyl carrier protein [Plantactinospora sp. CA-290183]|uniref:acyl carrier protein n=1 Tax=Plantactinospora sp. CA-290183 TaxID=3240006 RepID=UPI003D8B3FDB